MTRVGILGAGQLGAYLCKAGRSLNLKTVLFAESEQDVAIEFADVVIHGCLDDSAALQRLIEASDVVTFEKENIPASALAALQTAENNGSIQVNPGIAILRLIQNKATQNQWLVDNGFPTAPFITMEATTPFEDITAELGCPFVVKAQQGGYDGMGVHVVRHADDMQQLPNVPLLAEQYIDNRRELAVLVARDQQGQVAVYPCFEMYFDARRNVLDRTVCPAPVAATIRAQATQIGIDIVSRLDGVGIFAIEMFLQDERLWVNEISPRVHNVGHMTIEAQLTSQFEQHMRAVAGLPLGTVSENRAAAMINLLCEPGKESAYVKQNGVLVSDEGAFVHWYGKQHPRRLRKMGHITAVSNHIDQALAVAENSRHAIAS